LLRVVSPSTLLRTVSLSNGLSNHLIFGICDLEFLFLQYFKKARNSKVWGTFLCRHLQMLDQVGIGAGR
jgi:hypothetical protein